MSKHKVLLTLLALISFVSVNAFESAGYGQRNESLKDKLFKEIQATHTRPLSYEMARKHLFGQLHMDVSAQGNSIREVYCHKTITSGVGPMRIPKAEDVNCEHTWPQSKFSSKFSKATQKGDLHHLFPSDDKANGIRGNHPFADVNGNALDDCDESQIGTPITGKSTDLYFEPPAEHKGNVARALFYFSVHYQLPIESIQEGYLKKWNREDPVDEDERQRNQAIQEIQGNRNPFIDSPELAEAISDF